MVGVDIRALLETCNDFCTSALHAAAGQAVNRTNYEVTVEHLLLACLDNEQTDIPLALAQAGLDRGKLRAGLGRSLEQFRSGNTGRPVFSPLLLDLLESAWLVTTVDLGLGKTRSGAILAAFLGKPAMFAQGDYLEQFGNLRRDDVLGNFAKLVEASSESAPALGAALSGDGGVSPAVASGEGFIAKYCEDFTAKARNGRIDPVFGRDAEIRQIVDILARRRKNNPILVGEPGVGKTAVLEGLALRITQNDVPEVLQNVRLIALDLGLLEAGAGMKGEFERRLKGVLDEIKASETPIVLFIDEAHMLVGAGGAAGGSDAANLMKPALARGEIRTCAATTWKEYKKYFEKDPALARRFQLVKLDEPDVASATLILRGIRAGYEKAHKVLVRDDACEAAATLAKRFISDRFLPDKAIDLLDTACARVKVSQSAMPAPLEDAQRASQALTREIECRERDLKNGLAGGEDVIAQLKEKRAEKDRLAEKLNAEWQAELEAARELIDARAAMLAATTPKAPAPQSATPAGEEGETAKPLTPEEAIARHDAARKKLEEVRAGRDALVHIEVTPDTVARVVSDWTGIPVGRMAEEQAVTIANLPELLGKSIRGQDAALATISKTLQAGAAGLRAPGQPMGVFLLVGPSGVGKTQTGLALADILFGDEKSVVTVNMSEFQEKHTVSRLIGSPPGYVGYGEGGMLTEAVRRKPYSVVLLDEVEKAHIDVLNLFYQVFDKGTLTDGEGKEVNFANTILMLTSNLGTEIIEEFAGGDEADGPDMAAVNAALHPLLAEHFRPALLARMTVVPYLSLAPGAMAGITRLKLDALARRLMEGNKIRLNYTDAVTEQIVGRCSETDTGARNIDYILAGSVLPQLSQRILQCMGAGAMPDSVTIDVDSEGKFALSFDGGNRA